MKDARRQDERLSERPSPAVHSLTSSSCHRPKDGPEGGVTRYERWSQRTGSQRRAVRLIMVDLGLSLNVLSYLPA